MQAPQQTGNSSFGAAYRDVRSHTERLCEPLEIEDYIPQPSLDVSPVKWNIAHTTWFFEEMILKHFLAGYEEFDPRFGFLFNSYYNSIGDRTRRDRRGDLSRPTVSTVFEYRRHVDAAMQRLLEGTVGEDLRQLIVLGLNHEQQHQELLLSDLKYTLSVNPLKPVYNPALDLETRPAAGSPGEFIDIEGGIKEIGHSGEGFCFDNELARHRVLIEDLAISRSLVANAEFLEFIADGGYEDHRLWHSEGWDWVRENSVDAPLYWTKREDAWYQFTLAGERPVAPDAPVCHISFYEASAFAEWRGLRLPTEFEWEAASGSFEWGQRWEWTASAYLPYPGFSKAPGAVGEYNGKFMINQMVLRGASAATPAGHSRPTYRNFFHPHLRWQFTGLRLAR